MTPPSSPCRPYALTSPGAAAMAFAAAAAARPVALPAASPLTAVAAAARSRWAGRRPAVIAPAAPPRWSRGVTSATAASAAAAAAAEGAAGPPPARGGAPPSPPRVVFLGTPPVAARALARLAVAARLPAAADAAAVAAAAEGVVPGGAIPAPSAPAGAAAAPSAGAPPPLALVGVVTQPPARSGRRRTLTPSPVADAAAALGLPVLDPANATGGEFLDALAALAPDVCVTAAYGNLLPQAFLDIPSVGTLNIHPSLLPAWRGAAPVPRALCAGDAVTGVSVAETVLALDAGPLLATVRHPLGGDEQAPALLATLFDAGVDALLAALPAYAARTATLTPQDGAAATHAAKIRPAERRLTFTQNAVEVHNTVRGLAGGAGTWADFVRGAAEVRLKVLASRVAAPAGRPALGVHEVRLAPAGDALRVTCDDGSVLDLLTVQPPGKKAMGGGTYWNGLRGEKLARKRVPH